MIIALPHIKYADAVTLFGVDCSAMKRARDSVAQGTAVEPDTTILEDTLQQVELIVHYLS